MLKNSENFKNGYQRAEEAGENSSFIFTVCVKSVLHYHFKFACVVLQIAIKDFLKFTSKNRETGRFNWFYLQSYSS